MIRAIVAFLASVLTGVQAFLIVTGREGICLNDGCEVVDSFPHLPPLYFNIAGFVFFMILPLFKINIKIKLNQSILPVNDYFYLFVFTIPIPNN